LVHHYELLFLVNGIDKLTVRYRIPFFQVLSISHQTLNIERFRRKASFTEGQDDRKGRPGEYSSQ
jgi:hypothetical protein